MDRAEFLNCLCEVLELEPGSLKGDEVLEDVQNWTSLAVLGLMAAVDEKYNVTLAARELAGCRKVGDLVDLVGGREAKG